MASKKAAPAKKKTTSRTAKNKSAKTKKSSAFDPSKFICNVEPSKDTDKDWTFTNSVKAGALKATAAPPASVDLRKTWWSINNQESTGSCVGWATADGVGRFHMEKAGKITTTQMLSPRFVWMGSKETDSFTSRPESFIEGAGTTLKAAVDIARKYGFALESDLPFHIQTNMFLGEEDEFWAGCALRRVAAYFNLKRELNNWKVWLATKGPILVGLNVDASWDHCDTTGGNIDTFKPNTARGGHAVAVVGYKTDGRFIVRNSWGTNWGDNGFGYVSPAYIGASFFNESYGVVL
jgi:C1A family cysteine protease